MAGILSGLSTAWNILRPAIKTGAGLLNSILGDEDERLKYVSEVYRNPSLLRGNPLLRIPGYQQPLSPVQALDGVYALDSGNPKDLTEDQKQLINAIYTEQFSRIMSESMEELPYFGYDTYQYQMSQSYSVPIPTGTSLIETTYCCPIMNLGNAFKEMASKYHVYKIDGIELSIEAQNQNYSTQIIGYDTLVTNEDIKIIQEDLETLANGGNKRSSATGHSVKYYYAERVPVDETLEKIEEKQRGRREDRKEHKGEGESKTVEPTIGPDGKPLKSFSEYLIETSKIKRLVSSASFHVGSNANVGVNSPGCRFVSMRRDQVSDEKSSPPGTYTLFSAAQDFFVQETETNRDQLYMHKMPVYGKIHFAVSNQYDKEINLITTINYVITWFCLVDKGKRTLEIRGKGMTMGESQVNIDALFRIYLTRMLSEQNGSGSLCVGLGNGMGTGTGTGSESEKKGKVVSGSSLAEMIVQAQNIPLSPSESVQRVQRVLTYYTSNQAQQPNEKMNLDNYTKQFDWMGTARLYLSPLNLGLERLGEQGIGRYSVEWIRIKVLGITLSSSDSVLITDTVLEMPSDNDDEKKMVIRTLNDTRPLLESTSYTIGYMNAQDLKRTRIRDSTNPNGREYTTEMGDSFLKEIRANTGSNTNTFYGNGFCLQKTSGTNPLMYQYEGPYASELEGAMTYPLKESGEIRIERPEAYMLDLVETSQGTVGTKIVNTYRYSNEYDYVPSRTDTIKFQTEQGTAPNQTELAAISGANTPIYGMVQIDLPEDQIQTVYQDIQAKGLSTIDRIGESDPIKYIREIEYTNRVLNANFEILVEYGFRTI